jgi:hypothetical protein
MYSIIAIRNVWCSSIKLYIGTILFIVTSPIIFLTSVSLMETILKKNKKPEPREIPTRSEKRFLKNGDDRKPIGKNH